MKIAVVGGGSRCRRLMEVIRQHRFEELHPEIIAVADLRDDAPGMVEAREHGLFVTRDYNDFFSMEAIELIIELTGSMEIYNDILAKKNDEVRAVSEKTVRLFWEIARISYKEKKTHQELTETRAMYKALINDLIEEEVLVIAYDHRILDVNDTLLKKLGQKREDVIGKTCYEITHHLDAPCSGDHHPCPLIQTLNTRKPFQTTHKHLDKNNKEIYYSISTYPLLENGDVIGAIEVARDISDDIKYQKALMQNDKLVSIGRLSAGVAHEINNPLTTILTTAMLIQEDLDPADPNYEELETISREALRCRRIVTSLLDFARQSQPDKKPNDLSEIARESILLTHKQAAFKDVAVSSSLAPDMPLIQVDKGQIEQAVINLILNAVEATDPGGTITITTRTIPKRRMTEISVTDSGMGIPEERLDKIFDPFYTTKETGTGLGLAIIHGIVERHQGDISVVSKPGAGSTFIVRLPYGDNHDGEH